ncbi:MAG: hypothetical protein HUU49_03490 [Candidatus Buchananbacteria bacterium]|nr:hypothetical protein [Candidatus Buchananbacteria bacterium]
MGIRDVLKGAALALGLAGAGYAVAQTATSTIRPTVSLWVILQKCKGQDDVNWLKRFADFVKIIGDQKATRFVRNLELLAGEVGVEVAADLVTSILGLESLEEASNMASNLRFFEPAPSNGTLLDELRKMDESAADNIGRLGGRFRQAIKNIKEA